MKLILIVMAGVFTTTLYTQKFGFVAGFNFANLYDTVDAETDVGKLLKPRFYERGKNPRSMKHITVNQKNPSS